MCVLIYSSNNQNKNSRCHPNLLHYFELSNANLLNQLNMMFLYSSFVRGVREWLLAVQYLGIESFIRWPNVNPLPFYRAVCSKCLCWNIADLSHKARKRTAFSSIGSCIMARNFVCFYCNPFIWSGFIKISIFRWFGCTAVVRYLRSHPTTYYHHIVLSNEYRLWPWWLCSIISRAAPSFCPTTLHYSLETIHIYIQIWFCFCQYH